QVGRAPSIHMDDSIHLAEVGIRDARCRQWEAAVVERTSSEDLTPVPLLGYLYGRNKDRIEYGRNDHAHSLEVDVLPLPSDVEQGIIKFTNPSLGLSKASGGLGAGIVKGLHVNPNLDVPVIITDIAVSELVRRVERNVEARRVLPQEISKHLN